MFGHWELKMFGHSSHGGGESVCAFGQGTGNQLGRRLGGDVDIVNLTTFTLEGNLKGKKILH